MSVGARPVNALELPFRAPLDWRSLTGFLATRAIPEIERITPVAYSRTVVMGGGAGTIEARLSERSDHLSLRLDLREGQDPESIVPRVRELFDLDADPAAISARLSADPDLAQLVGSAPGLRVPGAWNPFELAVRAILGQQVTVRGAATLGSRLVRAYGARLPGVGEGDLTHLFPEPAVLTRADLSEVGLPAARAATIRGLAEAVNSGRIDLSVKTEPRALRRSLVELRGIGDWTAQYVTMRAAGDRDAFPASDLALLKAAALDGEEPSPSALRQRAEAWRPWRAYAAMYLWRRYASSRQGSVR